MRCARLREEEACERSAVRPHERQDPPAGNTRSGRCYGATQDAGYGRSRFCTLASSAAQGGRDGRSGRHGAKLVIINCDDLGMSNAVNAGVYDALRCGLATSASLMVPCPSARYAAACYPGEDVGVHLTLNAEWDHYRWGPITAAASLTD